MRGARLSSDVAEIEAEYEVVVVGSGYGASIAASRMARAGLSVCLLERGREILSGDFPETPLKALPEVQVDAPEGHVGSATGLYDFRLNPEVSVLVGCGLGGTSLINAGVALKPDPRVFKDGRWPRALADDWEILAAGYEHAEQMLRPRTYPESWPKLPKMEAQEEAARKMGHPFVRVPINVSFEAGESPGGIPQKPCVLCGNCITGCNHTAKNTTQVNYLPDAKRHGASIFTGVSVRWVERAGGRWIVHYRLSEDAPAGPTSFVRAGVVILGAGALGSTEILLRSRDKGLTLSGALGQSFTGNGDMISFSYNPVPDCNGIGWAGDAPPAGPAVGPSITSAVLVRPHDTVKRDVLLEEGAIPSAIGAFASDAMFAFAALEDATYGKTAPPEQRTIAQAGAASQTYLAMSLDDDEGQVVLVDDRARVRWPHAGVEPDLREASVVMDEASTALGGTYLIDPLWTRLAGRRLVTVHPLGGCPMADDAERGVVDDRCRVYAGPSGASVHQGLYVCDGSVVPSPLGVNPLLTISAITERACHYIAEERGLSIDYRAPSAHGSAKPDPGAVGIEFDESMHGFFKIGVTDGDFQKGYAEGEASDQRCRVFLTIRTDDLDEMLKSPAHEARLIGTAVSPPLSARPLAITDGRFNLLVEDPKTPGLRLMRYRMRLTSEEGRAYFLDGEKRIGDDSPLRAFHDATTLFTTIHDGPDERAPILAQGILTIGIEGGVKLLESLRAIDAGGFFRATAAKLRFLESFFGTMVITYLKDIGKW
ncbi:MAG: GMC family oxidoreductase [Byssovorax sp.]